MNNFNGLFSDKRLEKRASLIELILLSSVTSSIHGSTQDESEQKGFYRFLENERASEETLIKVLTNRCGNNVANRDVLVIQDSCSIGLSHNASNIKKKQWCWFCRK